MPLLRITVHDRDVSLSHSDGSESQHVPLRLSGAEREMVALFQDWLSYAGQNGTRKITRRRELEVLGHLLYDALLPPPLDAFFESAAARPDVSQANRLRVELSFEGEARSLAALPWEFLYRPDTDVKAGYFLATSPRLALSRYMALDMAIGALAPEDAPLRVLATASKPSDEGPVREAATIESISALPESVPATVEVLDEPTLPRFVDALERVRPHALHLIGHGTFDPGRGEGRLALVDDEGAAHWISDRDFAEYLVQTDALPRIVFLHACEGGAVGTAHLGATFAGLAPLLIRYGVQAVVAMQYPVTNGAATAFGTAFYGNVAKGRGVDAAVQRARGEMTVARPGAWDTGEFGIPVLYMRSSDAVMAPAGGNGS